MVTTKHIVKLLMIDNVGINEHRNFLVVFWSACKEPHCNEVFAINNLCLNMTYRQQVSALYRLRPQRITARLDELHKPTVNIDEFVIKRKALCVCEII